MAGAGFRTWVAGELVTDEHMQNYLQDQVILKYASIAARDAAPSTQGLTLSDGLYCTVSDTGLLYRYTITGGTPVGWVEISGSGGGGASLADIFLLAGM